MKKYLQLIIICFTLLTIGAKAQTTNVLVMGSEDVQYLNEVKDKLYYTGRFLVVSTFNLRYETPSISLLQAYDAVLVFSDYDYFDNIALGDTLAAYVDLGGGVVTSSFNGYNPGSIISGAFTPYLIYSNPTYLNTPNSGGTVLLPNHSIMHNVDTFHTIGFNFNMGTIATGANVVWEYSDGVPLIIEKTNLGPANARRAYLNFWPVSNDLATNSWNSNVDGTLIIANALEWAAGVDLAVSTKENEISSKFSIYPNPTDSKLTIETSGLKIERLTIVDVTGKKIKTVDMKSNTIDVSDLETGIYFLQIQEGNNLINKRFIKE